jgi:hypothetical protein
MAGSARARRHRAGAPVLTPPNRAAGPAPRSQARRRSRRRVEPAVKVESAAVAQATGAAPQTQLGEAETLAVQALGIFFAILLVEGLVLAGSVRWR